MVILTVSLFPMVLISGCSGTTASPGGADKYFEGTTAVEGTFQKPDSGSEDLVEEDSKPSSGKDVGGADVVNSPSANKPMRRLAEYRFTAVGLGIYRQRVSEGLKIIYVAPDSSAAAAGLHEGDIITAIDKTAVGSLQSAQIDNLLAGDVGQIRKINTAAGKSFDLAVSQFEMKNLGKIRKFDDIALATPSLSGLHSKLKPAVQLVIEGKHRAASRILDTLAGPEATNGSFYLVRAFNSAASHGMLASDSRVADQATGQTLTATILEDIDLAVEMDDSLRPVAGELLAWFTTQVVLQAAKSRICLTYVTPNDHLRWNLDTEYRYRSIGDWIQLLNKAESIDSTCLRKYLAAFVVARDRYLSSGDIRSAAFLDGVIAYRYCQADATNKRMQQEREIEVYRSAIQLLKRHLHTHPNSAMEVAAVVNAMIAENLSHTIRPGETSFDDFWALLRKTDPGAASFAIRYYHKHMPPKFSRLASPKEAFLFHIESFLGEDWNGFKASTAENLLKRIRDPQEFRERLNDSVFQQSMFPMLSVTSGLVPEFVANAAQYPAFVATNEHGVDLYLITMKLYDVHFDREVPALVPMSAQSAFPKLSVMIEQIVPEQNRDDVLSRAVQSGRADDLVIGMLYESSPGQHCVLNSAVINLLSLDE